jgi:hypothetical protein
MIKLRDNEKNRTQRNPAATFSVAFNGTYATIKVRTQQGTKKRQIEA